MVPASGAVWLSLRTGWRKKTGTIPLLIQWLADGMSLGSASAFMITGPATKITNLGALKIVLGAKHFGLYLAFVVVFSLITGVLVDVILPL